MGGKGGTIPGTTGGRTPGTPINGGKPETIGSKNSAIPPLTGGISRRVFILSKKKTLTLATCCNLLQLALCLVQVGHREQLASFQVRWPHQVECLEYLLKSGRIRLCAMRRKHFHAHDERCVRMCICSRAYCKVQTNK